MAPEVTDRSGHVADGLWRRVRHLAAQIAALEDVERLDGLDEDGRSRLASLRLRCARAADRAALADDLADRLSRVRRPDGAAPGASQLP